MLLERAVHRVEDRPHFVPWVECRLSSSWGIDRANMQHAVRVGRGRTSCTAWRSRRTEWTAKHSFGTTTPSYSSFGAVRSWDTVPETSSSSPGWCRPSTNVSISNSDADRSSRTCHDESSLHMPACSAARFAWLPRWRAAESTRSAPNCVLVAAEDLAPSQWRRVERRGHSHRRHDSSHHHGAQAQLPVPAHDDLGHDDLGHVLETQDLVPKTKIGVSIYWNKPIQKL